MLYARVDSFLVPTSCKKVRRVIKYYIMSYLLYVYLHLISAPTTQQNVVRIYFIKWARWAEELQHIILALLLKDVMLSTFTNMAEM